MSGFPRWIRRDTATTTDSHNVAGIWTRLRQPDTAANDATLANVPAALLANAPSAQSPTRVGEEATTATARESLPADSRARGAGLGIREAVTSGRRRLVLR